MSTVDPNTWLSLNLAQKGQQQVFIRQLVQNLNDRFSTGALAQTLNGAGGGALPGSAVNTKQATFSGVSTNQSLDCTGALHVAITMTFTANLTLTITNLQIGASVMMDITNTAGVAHTLTIAATAPGGAVYTTIKANTSSGVKDFHAGASIAASTEFIFNGQTTTGPSLVMVGN